MAVAEPGRRILLEDWDDASGPTTISTHALALSCRERRGGASGGSVWDDHSTVVRECGSMVRRSPDWS